MSIKASTVQPWSNAYIPEGAIRISDYASFRKMVEKWGSGVLEDTLICIGSAGIGKSETALATIRQIPHLYLKGQATQYAVYSQLFDHIDECVVLDDIDTLLTDSSVTGLLKMLLETRNPKIVQWSSKNTLSEDSSLPPSFETKSRTLILANELKQVSKNFAAVLDRSTIIWFAPNASEIHKYVGTWFDLKKYGEVYNYVGERLNMTAAPSCRFYYHAAKWAAAGLDWKHMIGELMQPSGNKSQLVKELLANKELKKEKERIKVWTEKTGETPQSYYAFKKAILRAEGVISNRSKAISMAMKKKHAERKANGKK